MLDMRRQQYLQALGVECYRRRGLAGLETAAVPHSEAVMDRTAERGIGGRPRGELPPELVAVPASEAGVDTLEGLQGQIEACHQCGGRLHRRKVIGLGNAQPRPGSKALWLVVSLTPGVEASRQGQIFSGASAHIYEVMFQALGVQASQRYCTSLVKCPASNQAAPDAVEQAACLGFLRAQIELIKPDLILGFGSRVGQALLGTDMEMAELRGRVHHYGPAQIPILVTYRPDWLLRHPEHKAEAWQDLLLARARVAGQ